jgi:hypothetical protein
MKVPRRKRRGILTTPQDANRRRQMAELVKFSGTCKEMMSFEELMELRERDLPEAARLYPTAQGR